MIILDYDKAFCRDMIRHFEAFYIGDSMLS